MCGIVGFFNRDFENIAPKVRLSIFAINSRGQEACGLTVFDGEKYHTKKGEGLVLQVLTTDVINSIGGYAAISQVRYATTGSSTLNNAQPMVAKTEGGEVLFLAHNGNLTNSHLVKEIMALNGTNFEASSDTEVLTKFLAENYNGDIFQTVCLAEETFFGSYSLVMLLDGKLIGVRDPRGIRPLLLGKLDNNYILASEFYSFSIIGAKFIRDISPGEVVIIDENGIRSEYMNSTGTASCEFEYGYLQDSTGIFDEVHVSKARYNMGYKLAKYMPEVDLITGVPETGIIAANGVAEALNVPFRNAIIKNRYSIRTFIDPDEEMRRNLVRMKLKTVPEYISGYRLGVIDDSMVRGHTSKQIVEMLKNHGAKEIHLGFATPKVVFPCYLGVDLKTNDEFFAKGKTNEEIAEELGVDSVSFVSIDDVCDAIGRPKNSLCTACFDGKQPVPIFDENKKFESLEGLNTI